MSLKNMIRTAECVSPKHPDKLCDQCSDAILDEALRQDPNARVAIEVMGGHGSVVVMGEMTTTAYVDIASIVKRITGINPLINVVQQSPEIAKGVDNGGAGDQGIMVGYACNETPELMPLETMLARSLCQFIYARYPYDGKTQITLEDGKIKSIVASFQNVNKYALNEEVRKWLRIKNPDFAQGLEVFCNPAGDWKQGGFDADTGLTGRKLMVDNYGPRVAVGGGAFSGKDATKVDRSGAYMARKLAVKLLKEFDAKEIYVYLAYAIGRKDPLQATVIVDGIELNMLYMERYGIKLTSLRPKGIITLLKLKKPQFEETAKWGHFGNGFLWDK